MILAHSAEYNRDGSIKINYQLYYTHIYNGKKIIDFILNDFFIDNFQDSFNLIKDFSKLKVAFIQALKIAWEYHDFGKLDNQCQNILSGKLKNVKMLNHVDAGVAFLCKKYKDTNNALFLFSAFLILAHHIGLPNIENIIKDNRDLFKRKKTIDLNMLRDHKTCEKYNLGDFRVKDHTDKNLNYYIDIHNQEIKDKKNLHDVEYIDLSSPLFSEFVFLRMALSILIHADHTDTSQNYGEKTIYKSKKTDFSQRQDKMDKYKTSLSQVQTTRNKIRNEFYDICRNYKPQTRISLLDGCVGMGKTIAGFHTLANHAKENPHCQSMLFIAPFIALNDQTGDVFKESIVLDKPESEISIIHSIFDYKTKWMRRYAKELNAPISIMTSVSFFDILTKNLVSLIKNFHKMAGTVIFIDEYHICASDKHWKVILQILGDLVKYFNVRIVFSSGTPVEFWEINQIKNCKNNSNQFTHLETFMENFEVEKIVNSNFRNKMIKLEEKRVKKIISGDKTVNELVKMINRKKGNIFVVLETISKCNALHELLFVKSKKTIFIRHSGLTPKERIYHIKTMKKLMEEGRNVILISTPGGNVGLDLSFHHGFQDNIGIDGYLQTSGRVSRNNEFKNATLTLFTLTGFNSNPVNNICKRVVQDLVESSKDLTPSNCNYFFQKQMDYIEENNSSTLMNKLIEYSNYYSNLNYDILSNNFNIIDQPSLNILIDKNIYKRILNNEFVKFSDIQQSSVNIIDFNDRRKQMLLDNNKIVYIEEEIEKIYGPRIDDSYGKGYGNIFFWQGEYDCHAKGIYADEIFG